MTREEAIKKLKSQRNVTCNGCLHAVGWCESHCKFSEAIDMAIEALKAQLSQEGTTSDLISRQQAIDALKQPVATDTNVGDKISKFIDGFEEIFADLREQHVDDSVCGLCEYDGAYMGQSGDWCNECPGFDRDDCFKLSDKTRKKWTEEIIKALPTIQPEPSIPLSWIEKHIEWLKGIDNEFAKLAAAHISVMVKKWRDEQDETD